MNAKPSKCLRFRRRVIARYARGAWRKGISVWTIRCAAEETADNAKSIAHAGVVYSATWMDSDSFIRYSVEA